MTVNDVVEPDTQNGAGLSKHITNNFDMDADTHKRAAKEALTEEVTTFKSARDANVCRILDEKIGMRA